MYIEEFGDDWPLSNDFIKILNVNQENLINTIDPSHSGLISILFSKDVISLREYDFISEKPSKQEKNTALLDIIRRRSVKDYDSIVSCFGDSNQKHVADILKKLKNGGGRSSDVIYFGYFQGS